MEIIKVDKYYLLYKAVDVCDFIDKGLTDEALELLAEIKWYLSYDGEGVENTKEETEETL